MKNSLRLLIVALCFTLILASSVYAAGHTVKLEVSYNDVKLVVDGVATVPKDVNGNIVEPFIYEGTTYLPVRAVGEALGKQVSWDGKTKTVYIGSQPGKQSYLIDVCPPYEKEHFHTPELLTMLGTNYLHAFALGSYSTISGTNYSAGFFNLNGQYNTLVFDVGHVDGSGESQAICKIYLDGELSYTFDLTYDMLLTHYEIPVDGVLQLKIVLEAADGRYMFVQYGFANAILS